MLRMTEKLCVLSFPSVLACHLTLGIEILTMADKDGTNNVIGTIRVFVAVVRFETMAY